MASSLTPVCINDEAFISAVTNDLNGYIFNDENDYCNIILDLVKNKNKRIKAGIQARIQAEHLSSSQFASNVLLVYEHALSSKNKYRYGFISKIVEKMKGE